MAENDEISDAKVVDVINGCYIVQTADGTQYQLPPDIGTKVDVESMPILEVSANKFIRVLSEVTNDEDENEPFPQQSALWRSARNPTDYDVNATIAFLTLRTSAKFEQLFNDKKTTKNKVWALLAEEMLKEGFNVGLGKDGADRCRQKYYNLQKMYLALIKSANTTGTEHKPQPRYMDLLHLLFGQKHSIVPTYTIDTMQEVSEVPRPTQTMASTSSCSQQRYACEEEEVYRAEDTTPPQSSHSRHTPRSSIRPKSNSDKMIEVIKNINDQQNKQQERHFNVLKDLLLEQNKYKKELLEILKGNNKKRRRSPSESP